MAATALVVIGLGIGLANRLGLIGASPHRKPRGDENRALFLCRGYLCQNAPFRPASLDTAFIHAAEQRGFQR